MPTSLIMNSEATLGLLLQAPQGSMVQTFAPLVLVFGIFWFLVLRPESKRRRELQAQIDALSKGDKVITQGGLYGEVAAVDEGAVVLKIADGVKVRITKAGIAGLAEPPKAKKAKD